MTETTGKPLAQQLYERHWRNSKEALPWESLYPHLQRTWERDVEFVRQALQPDAWDRAHRQAAHREREQLRAEVAKWRSAAEQAGTGAQSLREELAEQLALLSEVLDDLKPPASAPDGIRAWDVTVHVTADRFARWMDIGKVPAL